jgi:hypothetical protein
MKPKSRIPQSNAAWLRFLRQSNLATQEDMVQQKHIQLKRMLDRLKDQRHTEASDDAPRNTDDQGDST